MSLREQIEAARRQAAADAAGGVDAAAKQEAEEVIRTLPERVAEAVRRGGHSVPLCPCGPALTPRDLQGVAKYVYAILEREGLHQGAYVDQDMAGTGPGGAQVNWLAYRV